MFFTSLALSALFALASTAFAENELSDGQSDTNQVGQQVKTTSGLVQGHASSWKPEVSEYLGIPYAHPPVHALRFAPPVSFRSNDNIVAAKFSPTCPGNMHSAGNLSYTSVTDTIRGILAQAGSVLGEDCLTINVWTQPQKGEKRKAVMLWIYGGGFNAGNTDSPLYNGARLAQEKDVVVVSLNYRVHIFGFPGASVLQDKNPGLLDQRLGLEWVRDNIEAFSGDPKRITLFGQSAGGVSVDLHTYAWKNDPIVAGYIPSSGSMTANSAVSSDGSSWWRVSTKLGCGDKQAGKDSLECMRHKSMEDILNATSTESRIGSFGPTIDGRVVFSDYTERRAKGDFVHLPMLVGNTNNESGLYDVLGWPSPFRGTGPGINCLTHLTAKARADSGAPVWRYLYSAEWPNMDIGSKGAWHAGDIALWFGTTVYSSHKPDTHEEERMIDTMMHAWASFAKDPQNGLTKLGWPVYNSSMQEVIQLGGPNSAKISLVPRGEFDKYGPVGAEKQC